MSLETLRRKRLPTIAAVAAVGASAVVGGLAASESHSHRDDHRPAVAVSTQPEYREVHYLSYLLQTGHCKVQFVTGEDHRQEAEEYVVQHGQPTEQCPRPDITIVKDAPWRFEFMRPDEVGIVFEPGHPGSFVECVPVPNGVDPDFQPTPLHPPHPGTYTGA